METISDTSFIETLIESYTWTVNNWDNVDKTVGNKIKSPIFNICDNDWQLRVFPGGLLEIHRGYTSFYLANMDHKSVKAKYTLNMINGSLTETFSSSDVRFFKEHNIQTDGWGKDKFVNTTWVTTNTVIFTVTITRYLDLVTDIKLRTVLKKSKLVLYNCMTSMYENKEFSDVTIYVGDRIFHSHKCVLANCSSVFRKMLVDSEMSETNSGIINIDPNDIDCESFEEILKYIYTGSFSSPDVITNNLSELLVIATFYDIQNIVDTLQDYIVINIELFVLTDIIELLVISEKYSLNFVLSHIVNFKKITKEEKIAIDNIDDNDLSKETKARLQVINNTVITTATNNDS